MSKVKEYCDINKVPYINLDDGGIALDVSILNSDIISDIKDIINDSDEKFQDVINFNQFWDSYHEVTGLKKTDMQPAKKHWRRLTKKERKSALENIEPYFNSLPVYTTGKPVKKARTYLADKNFNDEFEVKKEEKAQRVDINQMRTEWFWNDEEIRAYCRINGYNPVTGNKL